MSALQNIASWTVPIAALIGFLGAIVAGIFLIASRKPDRMELVTEGAWRLKGEAERQLASALTRITDLEGQLRALADKLSQVESAHNAAMVAQTVQHKAEMEAQAVRHKAEMETKDGLILRLSEKVDALELKVAQLSAPVVTVSTTETTTTTKPH